MKNLLNIFFLIIGAACLALSLSSPVQGQPADNAKWQTLETRYTIIRYQSFEDLKKFDGKVDYSPGQWGLKRLFSSPDSNNTADNIGRKVDALYERVQEILGMRKQTKKIFINIYPDKNLLLVAYKKIYDKSFSAYNTFAEPRAWYLYELNTIYINVNDLREGMLAHEMGHAIIDHYLSVRPPRATAEILARYVDSHLYPD